MGLMRAHGDGVCSTASLLITFSLDNPIFNLHCEVLMVCAHDWQLESKERMPMFQGECRDNKKKRRMNCTVRHPVEVQRLTPVAQAIITLH